MRLSKPWPPCTHSPKSAKGMCKSCYWHDYKITNREKYLAALKAWRAANKDRIKEDKRKRWKNSVDYRRACRNKNLKSQYGITLEDYNRMSEEQGHLCAICRKRNTDGKKGEAIGLCVDHNHTTGKVRALLCGKCNRAVGNIDDSPLIARTLMEYLEKHEL